MTNPDTMTGAQLLAEINAHRAALTREEMDFTSDGIPLLDTRRVVPAPLEPVTLAAFQCARPCSEQLDYCHCTLAAQVLAIRETA